MNSCIKIYLYGALIHCLYLGVLLHVGSDYRDMYFAAERDFLNVTDPVVPDTRSYVESADNFLKCGTFGKGDQPDYYRTIGYPMILSFFKYAFDTHWYKALVLFQGLFAAINYVLIYLICKRIFGESPKLLKWIWVPAALTGAYFTRTFLVTTDLTFATFFLLGVYFSMKIIESDFSVFFTAMALLSIGSAGLIRPALILYFIPSFILMSWYSGIVGNRKPVRYKILLFNLLLAASCNLSSLRNYINHGTWMPTNVLGINMFDYTVKNVYKSTGNESGFEALAMDLQTLTDFKEVHDRKKEIFRNTVREYPLQSLAYWCGVFVNHMMSPYWQGVGRSFGYYKRDFYADGRLIFKESRVFRVFYDIGLILNLLFLIVPVCMLLLKLLHRNALLSFGLLSLIVILAGPTLIAGASERMRLPLEPVLEILAFVMLARVTKESAGRKFVFLNRLPGKFRIFSGAWTYSLNLRRFTANRR